MTLTEFSLWIKEEFDKPLAIPSMFHIWRDERHNELRVGVINDQGQTMGAMSLSTFIEKLKELK